MKKILLFLFFTLLSFSQEKKLTVNQIDSIVKTIKPKVESSVIIQKKKKIIGGVGNTAYEFEKKLIYSYYNETTKDKEYELNEIDIVQGIELDKKVVFHFCIMRVAYK